MGGQVKAIILTTAMLCLAGAAHAQNTGITGNNTLEGCRSVLNPNYNAASELARNLDDPAAILNILNVDVTRGICLGTVAAIRDFMDMENKAKAAPDPIKRACIPRDVTGGQLVRVVVAFADKHPDILHLRLSALTVLALVSTWPCPQAR
jgi:hypothetical protein